MIVELWHVILAVCGGGGAILLFLQRIGALKKGIEIKAITEALRQQDVESRIKRLEENDKIDHEMLTKIYNTVIELKNKSACRSDLNDVKETLMREIQRVELKIAKIP